MFPLRRADPAAAASAVVAPGSLRSDEPQAVEAPDDLNFELLSHISPIGWDNVLLYGEYQLNRSLVRSERLSV